MKLGIATAFLVVLAAACRAETFRHQDPDFEVTVPDSYGPPVTAIPEVLWSRLRVVDAEKDIRIFFAVEVLPGRISNRPFEKLSPSEREKLFVGQQNLKFRRVPWNGIEINVVEGRTTVSGEEILTVFAQFPLPKRGVQITLGTTAAYEDLMMADLQGIIGSFQGRADPVDPHEGDVAYSIGKLTAWAMMLAIPGYFIVRLIKREISGGSRPPEARMEPPKDNPTFHV